MDFRPKPEPKWTKSAVLTDAKRFAHKHEWKNNSGGAYAAANKNYWYKEATKHMEVLNPKGKWSSNSVIMKDAKKYNSRSIWMKASSGAYEAAKRLGCFEQAVEHMSRPPTNVKWTKTSVFEAALKYKYRKDFNLAYPGAYEAAKKYGWFDEVVSHMENKKLIPLKWTKEKVIADAKKYTTRSEWKKASPGAYSAAFKHDWYEEAVKDMILKKRK